MELLKMPGIPTDNLYKFFAISGLIISVVCSYMYIKYDIELQEDLLDMQINSDILNESYDMFLMRRDEIIKEAIEQDSIIHLLHPNHSFPKDNYALQVKINDAVWDKISSNNKDFMERIEFRYKYQNFLFPELKRREDLEKEMEELLSEYDEMPNKLENNERLGILYVNKYNAKYAYQEKLIYGIFIGILMAVAGFSIWYFRVQMPLDYILKSQYLEAKGIREKEEETI